MRVARRKSRFIFSIGWLIIFLCRGIELSRLAISRFKPRSAISSVSRDQQLLAGGRWVQNGEKVYWIGVNQAATAMQIRECAIQSN
jgi:hypothetical protein